MKAGETIKVERRSRFISCSLSRIWLLRSSGLHGKVGLDSASKRCRRNGNIVTGDTNMLVFYNTKIALPPTQTLKFALPPMQTPRANRWNIGRVGSPSQNRVGHVDFMLFVSLSLALGSQHQRNFQWNMGYSVCRYSKNTLCIAHPVSGHLFVYWL